MTPSGRPGPPATKVAPSSMPLLISAWILSHWPRLTTGPIVVPSPRGSPALVFSATPFAIAATSFIFDSGTIMRDGALQDHVRRLATELLADTLDGRRRALGDVDAGAGRAGEGDHVDVRMFAHG